MECSGSDANFFEYFKGEGPRPIRADEGMIASAGEFTGVPLATVLAQAGLTHHAAHVRVEGWDRGVPPTARPGTQPFYYDKGLPLEKAYGAGILLAVPALVLGFFTGFLLSGAITSLAFWTQRIYSLHEFYFALIQLFSGLFVPLTLMPSLVQDIARYLPFQLLIYFPIQLILGKLSPAEITRGFIVGVIWLAISILLFRWVWSRGVKQYSAVGA